jgi:hypothetical protein
VEFKVDDTVIITNNMSLSPNLCVGDIGRVSHIHIHGYFTVFFDKIHDTNLVKDTQMQLAEFTKSPLWRLMNDV